MIQILAGEKGQGKTKKLIDMANEASKTVDGNVVFIDDDSRHMYDLHYGIRFVETSKYKICSYEVLIGFIYGILSQNGDIQKVFIDGLGNITDIGKPLSVMLHDIHTVTGNLSALCFQ